MAHDTPQFDKLIVDSVGAMVAVTDGEGRIIRLNLGGQKMTGYAEHEVTGRPIWEVFPPPEFRERTRERFMKLMSGKELKIEATWLTKSGEHLHLSCYCVGVAGASGKIEYTIGTGVDVSARVVSEQALRVSEELFRTTFDNAAIGMALVDRMGRYLHVNRAFCELTGFDEQEILECDLLSITHPDDQARNRDMFEKLCRKEVPGYVLEKRYLRRDGEVVWAQVSASIASEKEGRPATIIGLFENISARKATQEKLEKAYAEQRVLNEILARRVEIRTEELGRSKQSLSEQSGIFQSIVDSMGDGVAVADKTGKLILVNPAAARISGPVVTEMVGERVTRPWYFRSDGQTRCAPDELPMARSLRGEAVDDMEILIRRPGFAEVWTSSTSRPLLDEAGRPNGAVVVFRDVTERKRHEAELQAANASLRQSETHYKELAESNLQLAREVEHRVRNNLQGLLGLLAAMRDRAADVPSFADAMESRLAAIRHVHQLLAQTQWKGVGLRSLVESALATLQHLGCFPIEMHISGPDLFIGPRQLMPLTLVIIEWFTNSCKYGAHSGAGGRLDIKWETVGDTNPPRVRLSWTERGGPPIKTPIVPSLGTELVQGFIRRGLAGTLELRYPPEGADHVIEFTVRSEGFV